MWLLIISKNDDIDDDDYELDDDSDDDDGLDDKNNDNDELSWHFNMQLEKQSFFVKNDETSL